MRCGRGAVVDWWCGGKGSFSCIVRFGAGVVGYTRRYHATPPLTSAGSGRWSNCPRLPAGPDLLFSSTTAEIGSCRPSAARASGQLPAGVWSPAKVRIPSCSKRYRPLRPRSGVNTTFYARSGEDRMRRIGVWTLRTLLFYDTI